VFIDGSKLQLCALKQLSNTTRDPAVTVASSGYGKEGFLFSECPGHPLVYRARGCVSPWINWVGFEADY
jgi:hypothetical protein